MANALYDNARQSFLDGGISWANDTIKCILIDTGLYTPNLLTDMYLSEIPAGARISVSASLAAKTSTAGVADSNDAIFTTVIGNTIEALVIFSDTGNEATSKLIAFIDTGAGLPITPNGGDVIIQWGNGSSKIFKL